MDAAIAAIEESEKNQAYLNSQAIALFAQSFSFSKGVKDSQTHWFNPFERQRLQQQAELIYPERSAALLLDLVAEGQAPGWIVQYVDFDQLKLAAKADDNSR